ncbi:MAG: class I SAM-dependent methyltransferase [Actinomycetota bacterium]
MNEEGLPKLYGELAGWYYLLTAPEEYAEEAAIYRDLLTQGSHRPVEDVLELGSGGGANASFLKERFRMTLVDLSPEMLDNSRSLNPECEHVVGDMRTVRLERDFDAVFVHDAIDYILTEDDLAATVRTAFEHCRPGGAALFVPDYVRETFVARAEAGGHDGRDGDERALRYLEWDRDPDPDDAEYVSDFAYLLKEADGTVRVVHDRHRCGLFSRDTWRRIIETAGFRAEPHETHIDDREGVAFLAARPEER